MRRILHQLLNQEPSECKLWLYESLQMLRYSTDAAYWVTRIHCMTTMVVTSSRSASFKEASTSSSETVSPSTTYETFCFCPVTARYLVFSTQAALLDCSYPFCIFVQILHFRHNSTPGLCLMPFN